MNWLVNMHFHNTKKKKVSKKCVAIKFSSTYLLYKHHLEVYTDMVIPSLVYNYDELLLFVQQPRIESI